MSSSSSASNFGSMINISYASFSLRSSNYSFIAVSSIRHPSRLCWTRSAFATSNMLKSLTTLLNMSLSSSHSFTSCSCSLPSQLSSAAYTNSRSISVTYIRFFAVIPSARLLSSTCILSTTNFFAGFDTFLTVYDAIATLSLPVIKSALLSMSLSLTTASKTRWTSFDFDASSNAYIRLGISWLRMLMLSTGFD